MSFASESAASLLSNSQSSPSKNFGSALADLQSTYGAYGCAPMLPASQNNHKGRKLESKSKALRSDNKSDNSRTQAFGDLQSSYGFVGGLGMSILVQSLNS